MVPDDLPPARDRNDMYVRPAVAHSLALAMDGRLRPGLSGLAVPPGNEGRSLAAELVEPLDNSIKEMLAKERRCSELLERDIGRAVADYFIHLGDKDTRPYEWQRQLDYAFERIVLNDQCESPLVRAGLWELCMHLRTVFGEHLIISPVKHLLQNPSQRMDPQERWLFEAKIYDHFFDERGTVRRRRRDPSNSLPDSIYSDEKLRTGFLDVYLNKRSEENLRFWVKNAQNLLAVYQDMDGKPDPDYRLVQRSLMGLPGGVEGDATSPDATKRANARLLKQLKHIEELDTEREMGKQAVRGIAIWIVMAVRRINGGDVRRGDMAYTYLTRPGERTRPSPGLWSKNIGESPHFFTHYDQEYKALSESSGKRAPVARIPSATDGWPEASPQQLQLFKNLKEFDQTVIHQMGFAKRVTAKAADVGENVASWGRNTWDRVKLWRH